MLQISRSIKSAFKKPEILGLWILILGHTLASDFSFGFHHPDEHFQILEFANYWVGLNPNPSYLRWEFGAEIRPWFQPMLHGVLMKSALAIGHYNPFTLAFLSRLLYSGFNIYALVLLWRVFQERYNLNRYVFLWIALLWFFPYIHARTSSENLSGIFLSFAFYHWIKNRRSFITGLLFGFAFLARYQIALGLFGMGALLIYNAGKIKKSHWILFLGFLSPVAIGTVLDKIGYGHWVFVPYRYFKVNLVDGVAATFNPYPWYQYFIWIAQLNPFISLPLFVGTLMYCVKNKKEELSAFVISFFFLHLFITNKEYRFLFPLMNLAPFMAVVAFNKFKSHWKSKIWLSVYAAISVVAFCISSLHGASVQTLWCVHMVDRYARPNETWLSNRNYLGEFDNGYYHIDHHKVIDFHSGNELEKLLMVNRPIKVLIDGKLEDQMTLDSIEVMKKNRCWPLVSAHPLWIYSLRDRLPFANRLVYKVLYRCL